MTNNSTTNKPVTNDLTTKDRELDLWREQWSSVAQPSAEFQRQVQERIKAQDRRFWLGNLLAGAALAGMLVFGVYEFTHYTSALEKGAATGVFVLLFVSVVCRLWFMRGTWRAETQSIHAFVELWQRRVQSYNRRLQIGIYIAIGWLVFCVALAAFNWATIKLDVRAYPAACFILMVIIAVTLPLIWLWVMWLRRRKAAELNEVTKLLEDMETTND
jgi:hypothetical protein